MASQSHSPAYLVLIIALGALVGLLFFVLLTSNVMAASLWFVTGKLKDNSSYMVYLPDGLQQHRNNVLVFALSPTADALSMLAAWSSVAEQHKWIVAASKEFQNGQDFGPSLQEVETELNDVEGKYAIDRSRVIFHRIFGRGDGCPRRIQVLPRQRQSNRC